MTELFQLEPIPTIVANLPHPNDLRRQLRTTLGAAYTAALAARGAVHVPEDTFEIQRRLAVTWEAFDGYARAFADAKKLVAEMQFEQLVEAVGEQDGIPNQGLTIPDTEGDVHLSREHAKARTFDFDTLIQVVAAEVAGEMIAGAKAEGEYISEAGGTVLDEHDLTDGIRVAINRFLELGKFEPQITKVNAYAQVIARHGDDRRSSVVTGAVTEKQTFKGVKFERKKP